MSDSVLIFGGSRGIGKILAKHFSTKHFQVSAASRNNKSLEELKREMTQDKNIVNIIKADISDEQAVFSAFESHKAYFGSSPTLVINTAAIQGPIGPSWTLSSEEWNSVLRINLFGCFLITKKAIQAMIAEGVGSIIHFSGGGAAYARPNFSAYGVSKTGLLRLVETVAEELRLNGYLGIIINAIAPGAVKTQMMDNILEHTAKAGEKEKIDVEKIMKSGGTPPKQIIALVEFLRTGAIEKRISGRLIHVRENYVEFTRQFAGNFPEEAGKLRRVPLI
jgi:3-oxoacyl-[acyl-carrier protein] reductase